MAGLQFAHFPLRRKNDEQNQRIRFQPMIGNNSAIILEMEDDAAHGADAVEVESLHFEAKANAAITSDAAQADILRPSFHTQTVDPVMTIAKAPASIDPLIACAGKDHTALARTRTHAAFDPIFPIDIAKALRSIAFSAHENRTERDIEAEYAADECAIEATSAGNRTKLAVAIKAVIAAEHTEIGFDPERPRTIGRFRRAALRSRRRGALPVLSPARCRNKGDERTGQHKYLFHSKLPAMRPSNRCGNQVASLQGLNGQRGALIRHEMGCEGNTQAVAFKTQATMDVGALETSLIKTDNGGEIAWRDQLGWERYQIKSKFITARGAPLAIRAVCKMRNSDLFYELKAS